MSRLLTFLCLSLLLSCADKLPQDPDGIPVNLEYTDSEIINYSEFIDSITYLDLETTEDCMIGQIRNIQFTDSFLVVFDGQTRQILLFDHMGRFNRQIGKRGEGPYEYINPITIDIDRERNHVLVLDNARHAVIRYGFDGAYFGNDSIGVAEDMAYLGNDRYLTVYYNDTRERAGVFLVSANPLCTRKIVECRDNLPVEKSWEIFRDNDKVSLMSREYENRLYEWNGDSLVRTLSLAVEPQPTLSELAEIIRIPSKHVEHFYRMMFCNGNRWYYTYFWKEDDIRFVLGDKVNNKFKTAKGFINDIDGVTGRALPACYNGAFVREANGIREENNPRLQFLHLKK